MSQPHALVLGASGISGWSLLNQLRSYPTQNYWKRITGFTNRPFSFKQARIPAEDRIQLASGIDLTGSVDQIVSQMKTKVADISTVTHMFFTAYIEKDSFEAKREVNTLLLKNAVIALETVSPNLQSVILQTGGKGYGLEFPDKVKISPPLREDMPRIPEPEYSNIFYYTQYDTLKDLSAGKNWTFSEVRPDGIIGFVPGNNFMNLAQGIALYLSIYRIVHSANAQVPFPGSEHGYNSKHSDTFQDLLAKMEIFAATNPEKCGDGGVFNVANEDDPISWSQVWPGICAYFGLEATGPKEGSQPIQEFVEANMDTWEKTCGENGLNVEAIKAQNWPFIHFMMVQFDFDRQYDLSRSREIGFTERIDTVESYRISFDRMADAKIIPKF